MTQLTNWARLDVARELAEIEAAHGSPIFDNFSALSPERTASQTAAALALQVTQYDLLDNDEFIDKVGSALSDSGGGAEWLPELLTFANRSFIDCDLLTATNNHLASFFAIIQTSDPLGESAVPFFILDPADDAYCQNGLYPNGHVDLDFRTPNSSSRYVAASTNGTSLNDGTRHTILATINCSGEEGARIARLYVDDVNVEITDFDDTGPPFTLSFDGKRLTIGNDLFGDYYTGQLSLWLAPGQSLLTDDDISLATRRKFVDGDGNPVSLGSDGSLPTGIAPAVFISSNSTNKGSGGALIAKRDFTTVPVAEGGPTAINCTGLAAGATIYFVQNTDSFTEVTSEFEGIISVNDQIQQTGSTDFTGVTLIVTTSTTF